MTVSMEKYNDFLRQFEVISQEYVREDALDKLKEEYKDEIHSKRVLENITNVRTLLKVLEKRGILQCDDISALKSIAQQFVKDETVQKLIVDYTEWLDNNSSQISNLYSCGKSTNSSDVNNYPISVIAKPCENRIENSIINETEEQCQLIYNRESPNFYVVMPSAVEYRRDTHSATMYAKFFKKYRWKNLIFHIIISLLLVIIIGIFWILVKLSYESTAIVPKADPGMPFYAPNINVGISVDPRFVVNQTQYHATAEPVHEVNREKQLQDTISKKVGKKIGRFWRDVSRRLNIEESNIESIETKYFHEEHAKEEKMFKEALDLYFMGEPRNWKIELMRALELSRRKDLKELVEGLIHQHES